MQFRSCHRTRSTHAQPLSCLSCCVLCNCMQHTPDAPFDAFTTAAAACHAGSTTVTQCWLQACSMTQHSTAWLSTAQHDSAQHFSQHKTQQQDSQMLQQTMQPITPCVGPNTCCLNYAYMSPTDSLHIYPSSTASAAWAVHQLHHIRTRV